MTSPSFPCRLPRQRIFLVVSNTRVAMREWKALESFPNLMRVHRETGAVRLFPYSIQFPNNSAETCLSRCSQYGYAAAGLEVCGHPFQSCASILSGHSSPMNAGAETLRWLPKTVDPKPLRPIVPWLVRALPSTSAAVLCASRKLSSLQCFYALIFFPVSIPGPPLRFTYGISPQ